MGIGPIPASKIKRYACEELGLEDADEAERFFSIIRQLDDEYIALSNEKSKPDKQATEVAPDDVVGVTALFSNLEARSKSVHKKPKKT